MYTKRFFAGALLCALVPASALAAKEHRGFQAQDAATAGSLPIHVVVLQDRLRPQISYNYMDTSQTAGSIAGNLSAAGASFGQAVGGGLVGGLIAGAIINGAELASAKNAVRDPYALVKQARCDLVLTDSHQAALVSAIERNGWKIDASTGLHALTRDQDPEDVVGKTRPRYVFTTSTSFTPDFSTLITTVDSEAFIAADGDKADRSPAWKDSLIVVSEGVWLPPKTQADIDLMVAAEKARYASTDADALIAKVNAAGSNAHRRDRKRAESLAGQHRDNMKEARSDTWSMASEATRRALLWSENDCAKIRTTLQANLEQAGLLMDGLFTQSLPARLKEDGLATGTPEPGKRSIEPLPGGAYVSRLGGENVTLGYRHMVLSED
jgi:hypothetical protein